MAEHRRKNDKTEPFKVILSIISPILITFIGFYMTSIKSDITGLRTEIKELRHEQQKQLEKIFEFSQQCKDEINHVRKETSKNINDIKDRLLAMTTKAME